MSRSSDVVVVGGGIVGTAAAYELASRGLAVTLLEAATVGHGASSRNLGYVWAHTRRPGAELDLIRPTLERLPTLADELDADVGYRANGGLIFFTDDRQEPVMREFVDRRTADGVPMELLDGATARDLVPILGPAVVGATFCPLDAQIDPRRYAAAFARAAQRRGATILEGCSVRSIHRRDGRVAGVTSDVGRIGAPWVVLATGAWTPAMSDPLGIELPIRPMRLQVVQTEPAPPRLEHLLYGAVALKQYGIFRELDSFDEALFRNEAEDRHGFALLEAACQKADGSYLLGCAMDYPGFDWRPDLRGVALVNEVLAADIPELAGVGFARAWAGLLPYTPDNLPIIGPMPGLDGLVVAAGHVFGNGAGPTTGRLVADLVCGSEPVVDPTPYRADRSGLEGAVTRSVW